MAGGKETPRQKMIGMMYLVFIAMLALNMSKEVLSAFGFMNEELVESNSSTTSKNEQAYKGLSVKAQDQAEKYAALNKNASVVKEASTKLYNYLEALKIDMTKDLEDKTAYESMDKTAYIDENFFKGDGYTAKGKAFVSNIDTYRKTVVAEIGAKYPTIKKDVEKRFNTSDVISKKDKIKKPWLDARYKGFPLVASLTSVTQLQANIRNTESDVLNALLGGQLEADSKMTGSNYKGIVSLNKTAYFAGEKVEGQVVLGRYDANLVPTKVTLNGRDITKDVKNGQIILDMPAGNVGNKDIKGEITFMQDGEPAIIPFESKYSVISQPSEAVISADKMNVLYRGLENPVSVSLPGIGDKDLTVSATGLKKTGVGKYMISPGKSSSLTINVKGKLSPTKTVESKKTFRVKDIPAAQASAREQYGIVKMPKSSLGRTLIGAGLPDFVFDLKLKVNQFSVKVPGQLTVVVKGSKFSAQAKKVLAKARKGDLVTIFDVKASIIGNSSYTLKKVLPVSIEITN